MVGEYEEREDKFDVEADYVLPDLAEFVPAGGRTETASYRLTNTYFDTASADLRHVGLTLRRRVGGPDAGWHLKIPAGRSRAEIRSKSRLRTIPKSLGDALLGTRRGQELVPVANLSTTRNVARVLSSTGELMFEVSDDQVESSIIADATTSSWREVEVELGSARDEELLAAVGERLLMSGARRSVVASKLVRAIGAAESQPSENATETLGDVISEYLSAQCVAVVHGDVGLRLGKSVAHRTRVALRRLRSTLCVFKAVFDPDQAAAMDGELVWLAGLLGEVRDRDILADRLKTRISELPAEYVLGPVAADIESTLMAERVQQLRQVGAAMKSHRYQELLEQLERWRTAPPFTDEAAQPALKVKKYVAKAERKLDQRLSVAGDDPEALHRARKAGKRFRYTAELSSPVRGMKASKKIKAAKKLQKLLGEHQDSVVCAAFLRREGAAAGGSGQNGFTYGILLAEEWQRAEHIRKKVHRRYN